MAGLGVNEDSEGKATEGTACWLGTGVEVGAAGEGEVRSAGRLQAKIARATIRTTDPGLRGSKYFMTSPLHVAF